MFLPEFIVAVRAKRCHLKLMALFADVSQR